MIDSLHSPPLDTRDNSTLLCDKCLVLTVDKAYSLGIPVIFSDLASFWADKTVHVYVMHLDMTKRLQELFRELFQRYFDGTIEFIKLQDSDFEGLVPFRGSYMTYARLLLERYLDPRYDETFYCDTDIHLKHGLEEFEDVDMTGKAGVVVQDQVLKNLMVDSPLLEKEQIEGVPYFNAGLVRINLDYWRKHRIMEQALKLAKEYPGGFKYCDQTILNHLLYKDVIYINYRNNCMIGNSREEKLCDSSTPLNIHFIGYQNPWDLLFHRQFITEWRKEFNRIMGESPLSFAIKHFPKDFFIEHLRVYWNIVKSTLRRYKFIRTRN